MSIAAGSAGELATLLVLANDLGLAKTEAYLALKQKLIEIRRMLYAMRKKMSAAAA